MTEKRRKVQKSLKINKTEKIYAEIQKARINTLKTINKDNDNNVIPHINK